MKKVFWMALLVFMALPVGGAFASGFDYRNGLFDDPTKVNIIEHNLPATYIDNRLEPHSIAPNSHYINFKESFNVSAMYLNMTTYNTFNQNYFAEFVFLNGETYTEKIAENFSGYIDLNLKNVVSVNVKTTERTTILELELFGEFEQREYEKINNLTTETSYNSILLSWENPVEEDFKGVNIKYDNEIIELNEDQTTYEITNLKPETQYNFSVFAAYSDGGLSEAVETTVNTKPMPALEDVTRVLAKADYNRIDLSWQLPPTPTFKHVNIYRDIHEEQPFLMRLFSSSTTGATTKIFETNGTYFNDLTVEPRTTYDYTLTTTDGYTETDGVDIRTTTPAPPPPPDMEGVEVEPQPNGDYLYKWASPTEGEVKIVVGGKEYKVVPAVDQQLLIPKEDMAYTGLGNPDVSLVAINEYGDEGKPLEPEKDFKELPFNVGDLLQSGMGLLKILGPIVLLSLAFRLLPRLIAAIKDAIRKHKGRGES